MTYPARYMFTFHGLKRIPFVLAAMFAATIQPGGVANAQSQLFGAIDGQRAGARKSRSTILALDSTPSAPSSRASCDLAKKRSCEELVQDNILWKIDAPDDSASKHWQQKNLDDLCACTADPYATVNCFQIQVNNNRKSWQEAIAACRAKP